MLHANGTHVVKFFLNIGKDEQKKRLLGRIDTPSKNWKFNAGDLKERARWNEYLHAYGEAIEATATKNSPWYVVPADDKGDMRLIVGAAILGEMRRMKLKWPVLPREQLKDLVAAREALLAEN
jgi:polyphosphate kinase 2 (PPK2 family)